MPLTHYNLSSEIYRSRVLAGFSQLQKEEEFVDLTLAADGCFCKVHRSVIALASPYLRDILRNLHGNAPVIYLNKIRKEILEHILEYIYQGEVNIPVELIEEFIEVSKSLHIAGIADHKPPKVSPEPLKSIGKQAKKRKLERVPNIEDTKPTDCTILTDLCESANIDNNYNDDYCMEDQNKSSNVLELCSLNTKHNQESKKLLSVKNTNKDLITFHARKEKHNPSIDIENDQPLEIPIETIPDLLIDQSSIAQSYKIIVKATKEQTEATDNIPLIEIQACPSQQDNNITIGLPNELSMLANISPDQNDDSIQTSGTDYITQSSQVSQPLLIEIGSIPVKVNEGKAKPVLKMLNNGNIKRAEDDYDTPAFEVSQPPIQTNKNLDQNNVEQSVPVINILNNNEDAVTVGDDVGESSLKATLNDMKNMAQYSITERGALQLILNRYIYCCHGTSSKKQRWRCINYRRGSCPAIVDTDVDGAIVRRIGIHGHQFHDKKILQKHNSGLIFTTMELAIIARNTKQKEHTKILSIVESDDDDNYK